MKYAAGAYYTLQKYRPISDTTYSFLDIPILLPIYIRSIKII